MSWGGDNWEDDVAVEKLQELERKERDDKGVDDEGYKVREAPRTTFMHMPPTHATDPCHQPCRHPCRYQWHPPYTTLYDVYRRYHHQPPIAHISRTSASPSAHSAPSLHHYHHTTTAATCHHRGVLHAPLLNPISPHPTPPYPAPPY